MKVRLVIEGNVQGAGYRAMVKNVARRLKIKGLVRNLDDGNVEGFCECDEKTLNRFIKIIDRKGDPEQPFSLNVEKINVYKEGDVNCVGLPEEFGLFETDYRMEIDPVHKDSLERSEIGILVLSSMHQDLKEGQDDLKEGQNKMLEKQDKMIEKQDETIAAIKGLDKKQDVMIKKQDVMIKSQDKMIEKQDTMIEKQDETTAAIKGLDKKQDKMIEKQDTMIEKQDETIGAIKGLDKKQDITIDVLRDFRDSTKQSFTDMGDRYGSIQDELVNTRKELAKLVEHIGVLVEEHIKRKGK